MKRILLAVCLAFGGASLVVAQDQPTPGQTPTQSQSTTQDQENKQQISVSELPDAVTAKLESQDFSGWTVGNAYKKMDESNQEMYVVELRQGTETKKVKFDRDGNELDKGKHEDKADNSNYRDAESSETYPADQPASDESATEQSATEQSTPDESASETEQSTTETEQSTETEQADNTSKETEQQ